MEGVKPKESRFPQQEKAGSKRMADRSVAPGQTFIEVEYDYEYKSKDRIITIKQGEKYLLVKKTNEDWWQVRKDEATKPFYVPAQYVREVRRALMPPPKPLSAAGRGGTGPIRPSGLDIPQQDDNKKSPCPSPCGPALLPPRDDRGSPGSPTALLPPTQTNTSPCTLPRSRAESPTCKEEIHEEFAGEGGCSDKNRNDSESGDDLSSGSTDNLQCFALALASCIQRSSELLAAASPVIGYSALSSTAETPCTQRSRLAADVLVWLKHTDKRGRLYYYSADGSRSEWELPKIGLKSQSNHTPLLPGDAQKTRSLDRRLPDSIPIRPRHSSVYLHESNEKPSEKCGTLNMTKITEHGKKVRKNWTSYWTVLQGSALLFNKGQGSGTGWFGRDQKLEFSVELKGGSVDWASKDKSSKKHVLELKTRPNMELLLQSDNESLINEWHKALSDAIHTYVWESDEAIEEDMPESPENEKHDKEKEQRNSKKGRDIKKSVSMDNAEQKKKTKLMKLLTGRPTLQAVKDKGYIKDQVFGSSLSSLCQRESTTIPHFVSMCIDQVEKNGLGVDGLYRVSGNLAIIQKLRFAVNHDEKVDLGDSKWEDIHVTTGALKMFFRELPEPLFPYAFFNNFISAIKMSDYKQKVQAVKDLMKQLPRPNHDTIQALFRHLKKVIQHVDENRMTTQSVAIVFGPTLLRPEVETANMAVHMVYQNQIVELILIECETIFGR
ncbi:rho GTPase-activating 12-like isoform X2 [Labeo rohita]|uniref:Rho GTPase-activating 12-like isoform X2 n=1 Tax=Labeo rohita TaxID=84645 RepID=A0A498MDN6_LABRO|nr:rho GTPase-activating 12-like isoform X2 [Labeo rohita]